jgi:uncharacterized protein YlxW (UPF0749 family)
MNKGHRGMMFIIFLILGIVISLQFRGVVLSESDEGANLAELQSELSATRAENAMLIEQLTQLEAEMELMTQNIGNQMNDQKVNELLKQRDYEYFRAGLTPVMGRGIVITLQDAPAVGELDPNEYLIHDNNITEILDELKANGAQAISINGERLITTTKPVCAGPTIIVNDSRYPAPYVIKAIGDPDVLYDAIQSMAEVAFMRLTDIRIDIVKQDEIVVDRYHPFRSFDKVFKGLEVVNK